MQEIINELKNQDNIVLFVHENPDGDAIGSILSMGHALKSIGKDVEAYVEFFPSNMTFLTDQAPWLKTYNELDTSRVYNLAVAIDCGDKKRLGVCEEVFDKALRTINIDHHITNDNYANLNYIEPDSAAAGELVYLLLKGADIEISSMIAETLYLAIVSDTGGFKHQNTSPRSFMIAAELLKTGIDISNITRKLFYETTVERTKCLGEVLSTLTMELDGKVGILTLTPEKLRKYNVDAQELEGMVDFARDIRGAEIGIFIKPKDETEYKVSLRSNNYFNVSDLAAGFGGGGHERAAGCRFKNMSIEEIKEALLNKIKETL